MTANQNIRPEIKYVSIENLELWEDNPRFNDEAVPEVMKSIQEFGFLVPIVVDANMVVKAGNTRLKAAKLLGMKEVPVVRADHLTDKQMVAFALADNKTHELSKWDFKAIPNLVSLVDLPKIPGYTKADVDKLSSFLVANAKPDKPALKSGAIDTVITCPHCHQEFQGKAIKKSSTEA